jgi:hypothetical protein
MGPHAANVLDPRSWGTSTNAITLEVMRIVLATSLFAAGVELPRAYVATHAKSLIALVVPTMAIGWVTVAGKDLPDVVTNALFVLLHRRDHLRIISPINIHCVPGDCSLLDSY